MEIHKPKPVRSWRELLTEIGIIVLSVCIALAAEQAVEWWHWRNQVQEARQAIAAEMAQNIGTAIVIWRSQVCAERRLDEVAQILDKAAQTGVLPPVGEVGRSTLRLWRTGTWDSMVASQVVTHFPRQQLVDLAGIYSLVRSEIDTPDLEAWTDLNAISGPGRRLDPASEADLRRALGRARALARSRASIASLMLERVETEPLPFTPQDIELIAILRHEALNSDKPGPSPAAAKLLRGGFRICLPIGPAPAHYGQVPAGTAPLLTDERLKALPDYGAAKAD
jgi:hypothetical protein